MWNVKGKGHSKLGIYKKIIFKPLKMLDKIFLYCIISQFSDIIQINLYIDKIMTNENQKPNNIKVLQKKTARFAVLDKILTKVSLITFSF